ncbi:amidohydrolase [Streptomyces sulfonofaciens]|uniref:Amidohydrolase n=1 Tax=Streptomyces sulfonofaciens TaxID=68272 RepID=A0A919L5U6_9ACTN|nr:amidase [Streptomyces sulfonofaciens]GHH86005.1 amidohydrolase [Streptomyces sulfonofaciens]
MDHEVETTARDDRRREAGRREAGRREAGRRGVDPGFFAAPGHTVAGLAALLRAGGLTAADLTERSLEAIARLDGRLGAFVTVDAEGARRAARQADAELAAGRDRGPLHGVPVAVKDVIDVAGLPVTMGSAHFAGHVADTDAECVRRLRAAGAVVVGKTTTHEFAYGPTGDRTANGPSRNPVDPTRMSGGSSGGSAVAVAAGMVPLALGTDTGGSVRIPAALCGVSGFKPAYGTVPTDGVFPLAASLDHVGVLARTPEDCRLGYEALAGARGPGPGTRSAGAGARGAGAGTGTGGDTADGTAGAVRDEPRGIRVGWLAPGDFGAVDPGVARLARAALGTAAALAGVSPELSFGASFGASSEPSSDASFGVSPGVSPDASSASRVSSDASLCEVSVEEAAFPEAPDALAAFSALQDSEAYAVHADRVRERPELFGAEVLDRLRTAARTPGWRYVRALADRERLAGAAALLFDRFDLLALPTTALTAPELGARTAVVAGADVALRPALLALTSTWNLLGLPALTVPAGTAGGLPVGLQLVGRPGHEHLLFAVAGAVVRAAPGRP